MTQYKAETLWERGEQAFIDNRYGRKHVLKFDGGLVIPGSSSPHIVPQPYSDPSAVDPEEAYIAALSSCHMLWFLSIAAKGKFVVDRYHDSASGTMEQNAQGKYWISVVTLRPEVLFSGERQPTLAEFQQMHHEAHDECFIANSVKTAVICEPVCIALGGASG